MVDEPYHIFIIQHFTLTINTNGVPNIISIDPATPASIYAKNVNIGDGSNASGSITA